MLSVTSSGSFKNTEQFLKSMQRLDILSILHKYGGEGVAALGLATPKDTGRASTSWYYVAGRNGSTYFIEWHNRDIEDGFPVVVRLQFGYGTGTGGYVRGRDFINPAIKPIFDQIETELWKVVTSA